MATTPTTTPTFQWEILLQRAWSLGLAGFLAGFSHQYTSTTNLNQSLAAGLSAAVAGVFVAFGYDQMKFADAKRASNTSQS